MSLTDLEQRILAKLQLKSMSILELLVHLADPQLKGKFLWKRMQDLKKLGLISETTQRTYKTGRARIFYKAVESQ